MFDRFHEFFEESRILSMSRLTNFIAVTVLAVATIVALLLHSFDTAFNFGTLLAGLGGFNYGMNRGMQALETVKVAQAENPAPATPTDVNVEGMTVNAEEVNVEKTSK